MGPLDIGRFQKPFGAAFTKRLEVYDNPWEAVGCICHEYRDMYESDDYQQSDNITRYKMALQAFFCLVEYGRSRGIEFDNLPELSPEPAISAGQVTDFIWDVKDSQQEKELEHVLQDTQASYARAFRTGFFYEFSQGDLDRIQALINELRELVTKSDQIESQHKDRLLKRIEKLQSELHKRMSDLDRFWGIVLEFGAVAQRLGENAKPLVNRAAEIARIVWGVQNRALELPSNLKLKLPGDKTHEDENSKE
jgi:hypothetical protein